jgi:S-adenosylmethionine synthetase
MSRRLLTSESPTGQHHPGTITDRISGTILDAPHRTAPHRCARTTPRVSRSIPSSPPTGQVHIAGNVKAAGAA